MLLISVVLCLSYGDVFLWFDVNVKYCVVVVRLGYGNILNYGGMDGSREW